MKEIISPDWYEVLKPEFEKLYFSQLKELVNKAYKTKHCLPEANEVFNAFNLCHWKNLKVVILGQDPYPTPGHAHGLSFSVKKEVKPFPKSLNNIFKELHSDVGTKIPEHGDLEHWAEQGVLLLNSILTVEAGQTNAHQNFGWQMFTDEVIKIVSKHKKHVVFILWGAQAQKKESLIDSKKHLVLKSVHPSPLSAYRGFFGSKPFSQTNQYLKQNKLQEIKW